MSYISSKQTKGDSIQMIDDHFVNLHSIPEVVSDLETGTEHQPHDHGKAEIDHDIGQKDMFLLTSNFFKHGIKQQQDDGEREVEPLFDRKAPRFPEKTIETLVQVLDKKEKAPVEL